MDVFGGLNDDQQTAVRWRGRSLLIVAGPGSGKTSVIAARVAHRVLTDGVAPDRVLAITFTRRAAGEMVQRVTDLLGTNPPIRAGTFHWLGNSILRRHAHRLGLSKAYRLVGPAEAHTVLRDACVGLPGSTIHALIPAVSALKNGMPVETVASRYQVSIADVSSALAHYDARLRGISTLDLDDLQHKTVQLLREHPEVTARYRATLTELLVDEYQDTNPIQQEVLSLIHPHLGSLVAVGDEDQAIYGWRQASAGSASLFRQSFPAADVIQLHQTYRCTKSILRASNSLIEHNVGRLNKELATARPAGQLPVCYAALDETDEAGWIAKEIESLGAQGRVAPEECAVLFRINSQSRAVEDALLARNIDYHVVAGRRFYDQPEICIAAAYLRLALDPTDGNAASVLLGGIRGMGERRLEQVRRHAEDRNLSVLAAFGADVLELPAELGRKVEALFRDIEGVVALRHERLLVVIEAAIRATRILYDSAEVGPDDEDPLAELETVAQELAGRRGTLRGLVDRLTPPQDGDSSGRGVALSTLHAAKGLEYRAVFLPGCEEGLLPHRRSLDRADHLTEERRLCYVGMTRARDYLYCSYARTRLLSGQFHAGSRSRFLTEMGISSMDVRSSPRLALPPRVHTAHPRERIPGKDDNGRRL